MIEDHRLANALIHEANLKLEACSNAACRQNTLERLESPMRIAKRLLSGEATESDKRSAREALDPATLELFSL